METITLTEVEYLRLKLTMTEIARERDQLQLVVAELNRRTSDALRKVGADPSKVYTFNDELFLLTVKDE